MNIYEASEVATSWLGWGNHSELPPPEHVTVLAHRDHAVIGFQFPYAAHVTQWANALYVDTQASRHDDAIHTVASYRDSRYELKCYSVVAISGGMVAAAKLAQA